jgi:hypothetical protein
MWDVGCGRWEVEVEVGGEGGRWEVRVELEVFGYCYCYTNGKAKAIAMTKGLAKCTAIAIATNGCFPELMKPKRENYHVNLITDEQILMNFVAVDAPPGGHDRGEEAPVLLAVPRLHLPADQPELLGRRRLEVRRRRRPFGRRRLVVVGGGGRFEVAICCRLVFLGLVEVHALEVDGETVGDGFPVSSWSQCFKTFFVGNLWMFVLS